MLKIREDVLISEDGSIQLQNEICGDFFLDYLFLKSQQSNV